MWSGGESALDLVVRTQRTRAFFTELRCVDAVDSARGFQPRDVVEFAVDPATTPLSLVLLHVIAAFLLRGQDRDGGAGDEERVYLFDHECELTPTLLFHVLVDRLKDVESLSARKAVARRAMDRVTLYQCRDTLQWLATLNQLHYELLDVAPTPFLLAINRIDSFQPIDKMISKSVGESAAMSDSLLLLLKQFVRYHSPFVFASKAIAAPRQGWETSETMPSSWTSQVTKRIVMRRRQQTRDEAQRRLSEGVAECPSAITIEVRVTVARQSHIRVITINGHRIVEEENEADEQNGAATTTNAATTDAHSTPTLTAAELWGHSS
ncbi:hypothetical protein PINS_up002617 [Pythium insidiosum]|nr:hypothetical protein PINS_up002617 [Pythium insidiosum]